MIVKIQDIITRYLSESSKFQKYAYYVEGLSDGFAFEVSKVLGISDLDFLLPDTFDNESLFDEVYFETWLCTDTIVGLKLIVDKSDPTFVYAVTWQSARKNGINVFWVSPEAVDKACDKVLSVLNLQNLRQQAKDSIVDSFEV